MYSKFKNMKQIILFVIGMFAYSLGGVFGIVEFSLYMTKSDPCNWFFAVLLVGGVVLMTIYYPKHIKIGRKIFK